MLKACVLWEIVRLECICVGVRIWRDWLELIVVQNILRLN